MDRPGGCTAPPNFVSSGTVLFRMSTMRRWLETVAKLRYSLARAPSFKPVEL